MNNPSRLSTLRRSAGPVDLQPAADAPLWWDRGEQKSHELLLAFGPEGQGSALEVDMTLFELHQQNVATAIDYRARILNALLSTVMSRQRQA